MKKQGNDKTKAVCRIVIFGIPIAGATSTEAEIIVSEPANLGPVIDDAADVQESDFSHDGLELYLSSARPGGYGSYDIGVSKRETLNSPWQEPVNLGPNMNSSAGELQPSSSSDALELHLGSWAD